MHAKDFLKSLKRRPKSVFGDRSAVSSAQSFTHSSGMLTPSIGVAGSHSSADPEQGDLEDSTKASSSDATGPHASPNPSAADNLAARSGTDVGAKEAHQPARASRILPRVQLVELQTEDPTATEPTEQQPPELSTSQRLWNAAYDSLEKDNGTAKLARSYIEILVEVLGAKYEGADLNDPSKRQELMKELVRAGQAKIATPSRIIEGVGDVAGFILSAKGMIDAAIQNIPQAALPWAGVCVGLQVSDSFCSYLAPVD